MFYYNDVKLFLCVLKQCFKIVNKKIEHWEKKFDSAGFESGDFSIELRNDLEDLTNSSMCLLQIFVY